jgi:hypothetical protein
MDSEVVTAVVVGASGRPFGETGDKMAWTAKVAEAGEGAMGRNCPRAVTGSAMVAQRQEHIPRLGSASR